MLLDSYVDRAFVVFILDFFSSFQSENQRLHSKAESLEQQVKSLETLNLKLRQENESHCEQNERLKTDYQALQSENDRLKEENSEQTDQIFVLRQENDSLSSGKKDLLSKHEQVTLELQECQEKMDSVIQERRDLMIQLTDEQKEVTRLKDELQSKDNLNTVLTDMIREMELKKSKRSSSLRTPDEIDNLSDKDIQADEENREESECKVQEVLELAQLRADLESLTKHKNEVEAALEVSRQQNLKLTTEIKDYRRVKETSEEERQAAISAKIEAEKKLEFLESYFKKKEVELQVKLGELEFKKTQKEVDASSLEQHLAESREQVAIYKSQLESMKTELAKMEKNAHDNWVSARNAEQKASDYKNDASFLRQQLTMMANNSSASLEGDRDANSSSCSSMLDFSLIPPPPPPPAALFAMTSTMNTSGQFAPIDTSFGHDVSGSSRPASVIRDAAAISMPETDWSNVSRGSRGAGSSASSAFEFAPPRSSNNVLQPPLPPPPLPPLDLFNMLPPPMVSDSGMYGHHQQQHNSHYPVASGQAPPSSGINNMWNNISTPYSMQMPNYMYDHGYPNSSMPSMTATSSFQQQQPQQQLTSSYQQHNSLPTSNYETPTSLYYTTAGSHRSQV